MRADLHLDPTAFTSPRGNLGRYVLDRAASDPASLSASLVLQYHREPRGRGLSPAVRPLALKAADIVDDGAAVRGILDPSPYSARRRTAGEIRRRLAGVGGGP